jgi:hypothetical protein
LGLFGGPSGSGTSSTPSNSTAQAYQPQFQPQADQSAFNNLNVLNNAYAAGTTPGQIAAPLALTAAQGIVNNPYAATATQGAMAASNLGQPYGDQLLNQGASAGAQALSTGFDPQQALYNQQSAANLNQQNAINAMSGVAGTPYGAGVTGQNQTNFNNQWLNQALARQAQGVQTAQGAANLGTTGLNTIAQTSGLPYSAANAQGANSLNALSSYLPIGNSQYQIPQQAISDALQYMGFGQGASQLAGNLGQMGTNQLYQGLGGIGTGLGLATGLGGGLGGAGAADASTFLNPGTDLGLTSGTLADPALTAGTGGGFLSGIGDFFAGLTSIF